MQRNNVSSTLGIFAHANAWKTTLTENLLFQMKAIHIIWKVDDWNSVSDSLKVEKERWISVRGSLTTFLLNDINVQLIDTPGHIDFSSEVERALQVLDMAILVISWVEKVEPQTYTLWKFLKQKKIPIILFINKLDRKWSDYYETIQDIKNKIEKSVISFIDIEKWKNEFYIKNAWFDKIKEHLAELDDVFLAEYIRDSNNISEETVYSRLKKWIQSWTIFPVIWWSVLKWEWIDYLVKYLWDFLPTYKSNITNNEFSWYVYLMRIDDEWNKNFYVKVLSWEIKNRDIIKIDDIDQKIKWLFKVFWTSIEEVDTAKSWDIVIIRWIHSRIDKYIWNQDIEKNTIKFVNPLIHMNILPKWKNTSIELMNALEILNMEDTYLNVRYDKVSNQIIISLMWEIQSQIIQTLLKERFNIDSEFINPIIIHKETPSHNGKWTASYTSVSSVEIEVKPLPIGSWLVYKSKLSTDFLLKKYQKQTERLVKHYLHQWIYWWEVTDIEVSLINWRFDSMWSDPKHFNIAIPFALYRALKNSNMKIIEPITQFTIDIPKDYLSVVMSALSSLNAKFEILDDSSNKITIIWETKYKQMLNFQNSIISITSWLWVYSSFISRYEISDNQDIQKEYIWPDPRNETYFLIKEMKWSYEALDKPISQKKKTSSAKFKRLKKEKEYFLRKWKFKMFHSP